MNKRIFSKRQIIFCTVACLLIAGGVLAQPAPESRDRERIQSVIIGKYATEMDLTPEQAEKFFPRLRQFQDRMEAVHHSEQATRAELNKMSQTPNADPQQLDMLLEQRKDSDQQIAVMKQEFLTDISSFLTPQQVSRCSILLDELPQKVRQFIHDKERQKGRGLDDRKQAGPGPRRRGY